MKNLRHLCLATLAVAASSLALRAANVGSSGYTNDFSSQPLASDWSTFSLAGAPTDHTTAGTLDSAATAVAASSIVGQLNNDAGNPAAAAGTASWSSPGGFIQTRPTGNAGTLLMCTLVNTLGVSASQFTVSYDYTKSLQVTEEVDMHRVFYSFTGAAGSWVPLSTLSTPTAGRLSATVSATWAAGGTLYLLWADDNGSGTPDTVNAMDNFSVTAVPAGGQPVNITSQPQSRTVPELAPVSFTATVAGFPAPTLQWYTNDVAIPGATSASYSISSAPLHFNGLNFKLVAQNTVSNTTYFATSAVAMLTVEADTVRPTLLGAVASGLNVVVASFSEPLAITTVSNLANYSVSGAAGSLTISNVLLDASGTNLVLSVSTMAAGSNYTLTVSGVSDRSAAANTILAGSQAAFTAAATAFTDIGGPSGPGSVTSTANGYLVTTRGTNIAGNADQFTFPYQQVAGDFDFKVRIDTFAARDAYALAALMARESLQPNSRFAAAAATPSINGAYFLQRATTGANPTFGSSQPVNYPHTWLRLSRTGAVFTAYTGLDGQSWVQLGSATITGMPLNMYVGVGASAGNSTEPATVTVQDFAPAGSATVVNSLARDIEPLGPSSRRTALVISEVMYAPKNRPDGRNVAFIEIFNSGPVFEDIGGYRITGDVNYTFPSNTILHAGAFIVVAQVPQDVQTVYGITGVHGPYSNILSRSAGSIRLRNRYDAVLLEVDYESTPPWPIGADGTGHSLALLRPSWGEMDWRAWGISDRMGGSPGRADAVSGEPARKVVINEFLARTTPPEEDYIELFNYGTSPVDISGMWLSDTAATNKFRVPDGTVLNPRGFAVFHEGQLGFGLDSGGERIFLVNSNQDRVIDSWRFDAMETNSVGRFPDGTEHYQELATRTPGTTNATPFRRDIVINELMYDPPTDNDDDEFIELYNRGTNTVDISEWRFIDGIDFTFPPNTTMAPGSYVVVAKNRNRMLSRYPGINTATVFGNYSGTLANRGERVVLGKRDVIVSGTAQTGFRTNSVYVAVDELTYTFGGQWGSWAHGGGSSLELRDPNSDNRLAPNWGDSDETEKSSWVLIENRNGLLDNGQGAINELQVMLIGRGEALMDDVEVFSGTNPPNIIVNGTFEGGTTGWFLGGNHIRSGLANTGYSGSRSMHLRASSGGDNGANRVETDLTTTLVDNARASMRARFRWLRGNPHVLMKFHGNQLEASGILPIPTNLGTPGERNSIYVSNSAPAIVSVRHEPVMPAAGQPVVVSAVVDDPQGLSTLALRYRLDPATTLNTVVMKDDGTGGDAMPGDGIYSATIPGQANGTLAVFHILAADAASTPATNIFPAGYPVQECHVRFGDTAVLGAITGYRLWMTAANINTWTSRERLSNEPLDGTFVYGNYRVIYNAGARYRGSPFLRPSYNGPTGARCAYVWILPEDQPLLNTDELNLDSMEPADRDPTILREVTAFSIASALGLPVSHQRYVHVVINGVTDTSRGIPAYTDVQQPNGDYIDSWFAEQNEGEIFKIDDWFEFNDSTTGPDREFNVDARLLNYTTPVGNQQAPGGVKKQARYRWSWEKKVLGGLDDDYSSLFALVDALQQPDPLYTAQVEQYVNIEEWMTQIMVRHLVGDWDGYGYNRGKNTFAYRPFNGQWHLLLWDLDFALGCTGGHPPTQSMFDQNDPTILKMFNHPPFRRIYFRAMQRAVEGPTLPSAYAPLLEARYRALQANGIVTTSPYVGSGAQGISIPAWIDQRRANLIGQIPAATWSVGATTVNSSSNVVTVTGNAPVNIKTVLINGVEWPVTWTGVTSWSVRVPLSAATNALQVVGVDIHGNPVTPTNVVNATIANTPPDPASYIVINEIMFAPAVPGAEYIELFNTSSNATFDLSGWRVNGVDYTFPDGSSIGPRSFLVLARDRVAFWAAYGHNILVHGEFTGTLQGNGETISLIKPGATPEQDQIVDRVRYDSELPWPTTANNTGSSLQVLDVNQENARVGNWFSGYVPAVYCCEVSTPSRTNDGWRFVSVTGNIGTGVSGTPQMRLVMYLGTELGSAIIDDVSIVAGTTPEVGYNYVRNGDFESALYENPLVTNSWMVGTNYTNSSLVSDLTHSGSGALRMAPSSYGNSVQITATVTNNKVIYQMLSPAPAPNSTNTLSFWFWATNSSTNLTVKVLNGSLRVEPTNINVTITPSNYVPPQLVSPATNYLSPGAANQNTTALPTFQPLWLNEVQPENTSGIMDNAGQRDPWVEIYNASTNTVSLDGLYLSGNYTNLTNWAFPSGRSIGPGQYLVVFADGQPEQTTASELHTSFRLPVSSGSIALSRLHEGQPQVLDYLNYKNVAPGRSYGSVPDGQPFERRELFYVTAAGTNDGRSAPLVVFINEWMASNTGFITDPADADRDDWFELYNPSTNDVSIAGYYLTDTATTPFKYLITTNGPHVIPAQGYLLVWADNETAQNMSGGVPRQDLHVNFQLSGSGEQIGLYGEDGTVIDLVTFAAQTANVSEGRFPNGAENIYSMTNPTPRAPNFLPGQGNNPPVLAAIGGRSVFLNQTLTFQAAATESDPGQSLTYSLGAGAPQGATINPTTGAFSWTPATPGSFVVTVRVTDNGTPALDDSEDVVVNVLATPAFSAPSRSGNTLNLAWQAAAGRSYRVQYKNALTDAQWTNLGDPMTRPTDGLLSITADVTATPQRFFRIIALD